MHLAFLKMNGKRLVHESHIAAHVQFIKEMVAHINARVVTSVLQNDLDTAIRKLDDAIHYLGTLEECEIVMDETSGTSQDETAIATDAVETEARNGTTTSGVTDSEAQISSVALVASESCPPVHTPSPARTATPPRLSCTIPTPVSSPMQETAWFSSPLRGDPESPISSKSIRSRIESGSSAGTVDTWSSWNTSSDATASSEATASVIDGEEEKGSERSASPSPPSADDSLPIADNKQGPAQQLQQEVVAALPVVSAVQMSHGGKYVVPSKSSIYQMPCNRRLNPNFHMHKQLPAPPCNRHYLLQKGCQDPYCLYLHDYLLTENEVNVMRLNSKKTPCAWMAKGLKCIEGPNACHMGHSCPYGRDCRYAERCVFLRFPGMHDGPAIAPIPKHLVDTIPYSANLPLHKIAADLQKAASKARFAPRVEHAASPMQVDKPLSHASSKRTVAPECKRNDPSMRGSGRGGYRGRGASRGRGGRPT